MASYEQQIFIPYNNYDDISEETISYIEAVSRQPLRSVSLDDINSFILGLIAFNRAQEASLE